MSPYFFNVKSHHNKILTTNSNPRDMLCLELSSNKKLKIGQAIKLLGGIRAPKSSVVAVGGLVAVACSIHLLRAGRKWLRKQRASPRKEEIGNSHGKEVIQSRTAKDLKSLNKSSMRMKSTETVVKVSSNEANNYVNEKEDCTPRTAASKESSSSRLQSGHIIQSQIQNTSVVNRPCRNLYIEVKETDAFKCKSCAFAAKYAKEQHIIQDTQASLFFCHVSSFIALLVLYKASKRERQTSADVDVDTHKAGKREIAIWAKRGNPMANIWIFNPEMKPPELTEWKKDFSRFIGKANVIETGPRSETELRSVKSKNVRDREISPKRKMLSSTRCVPHAITRSINRHGSPLNLIETRSPDTRDTEQILRQKDSLVLDADISHSQEQESNREMEHIARRSVPTHKDAQKGIDNRNTRNTFLQTSDVSDIQDIRQESSSLIKRRKPRKRRRGRRNASRRKHERIENGFPVASQHQLK